MERVNPISRKAFKAGLGLALIFQLQSCSMLQDKLQGTAERHPLVFCGLGSMVTGGAVWAGCRYLIGGKTSTCVIGAVAAALADGLNCWWLLKQKIVQDYDDTRKKLRYDPSQGYVVKILDFSAAPKVARPGDEVKISIQYALMSPNPTDEIKFERKISLPGDRKPRTEIITYQPGTWGIEDFTFKIDASAPDGKVVMTFDLRLLDHEKQDSRVLCFNVVQEGNPKPVDLCSASEGTSATGAGVGGVFVASASKKAAQLKAAPKTAARSLGRVAKGQKYPVLETFDQGIHHWYKIRLDSGETGWLPASAGTLENK